MPNVGYVSEAAASIVDRHFKLKIVPRTEIVELASPSFYYGYYDKRKKELPTKIGSFQIYLEGYKDATVLLPEIQEDIKHSESLNTQFKNEFERLVILDYIIRNTGLILIILRSRKR